jgi:hypothetical protein
MTVHHLKQVFRFAAVKDFQDKSILHRQYAQSIEDDKIDQQLNLWAKGCITGRDHFARAGCFQPRSLNDYLTNQPTNQLLREGTISRERGASNRVA